jgi:DNA polymerase I
MIGLGAPYIDWSSAEFGVAAALSGDVRMMAAYHSGDIYMFFAIEAGAAPKGANRAKHREVPDRYKNRRACRSVGPSAAGLAKKLGHPIWREQELLHLHRRVYARYWGWSEWMTQVATFGKKIDTVFCWPMFVMNTLLAADSVQ